MGPVAENDPAGKGETPRRIPPLAEYPLFIGTLIIWASLIEERVGGPGLIAGAAALALGFTAAARSGVFRSALAQWLPLAIGYAAMGLLQARGMPLFWQGMAAGLAAYTCAFAALKGARRLLRGRTAD